MKKHDEARRAFLVGGAAAGAGAVAAAALLPEAEAKSPQEIKLAQASQHAAMSQTHGGGHGAFFNDDDSLTITAFAERLMPAAPSKPGATDAGVLNYIDLALSGAYSELQDFYRQGLSQLDSYCQTLFKRPFRRLSGAQQDEVILALEQGKDTGFTWPSAQAFFNTLRTHTMEGMFADPIYGGNKDFAGWRLVEFPGAQPLFTPDDMKTGREFTREPIVGLQSRATSRRG